MATLRQPNPRPPEPGPVPPGGPTASGKQPFPSDANAPVGNQVNSGATPQFGRAPHLGQPPPNGTNLARRP